MQIPMRLTTVHSAVFLLVLACVASVCCGLPQSPPSQIAHKPLPLPPTEARTDINHASVADLLKIPGMTSTWANRIVRFRPYRTKQDLLDHGVLPANVYDRIKDYVIAHRDSH